MFCTALPVKEQIKIEVTKTVEGVTISYPYRVISDTLKRLIFHLIALETNSNSSIIFEEPEVHAFPYYTKFFADKNLDKDFNWKKESLAFTVELRMLFWALLASSQYSSMLK